MTHDSGLVFRTLPEAQQFVADLPLANPTKAFEQALDFLDALLHSPLSLDDQIVSLEYFRPALAYLCEEQSRHFQNKALPLSNDEEKVFQSVIALLNQTLQGYALCINEELDNPERPDHPLRLATLVERCLYYIGALMNEYYRARRALPDGIWRAHHQYFRMAEDRNLHQLKVADSMIGQDDEVTCMSIYIAYLLIDLASPSAHSVRSLNLIFRWARGFASLASVSKLPEGVATPKHGVILDSDEAVHILPEQSSREMIRALDSSLIATEINRLINLLQQKVSPAELGLGDEVSSHVIHVLQKLRPAWTQQLAARRFRRFATEGNLPVTIGFEAIHFAVTGKLFEQPQLSSVYTRDRFNQLYTFRESVKTADGHAPQEEINQPEIPAEKWNLLDLSASGFRLTRRGRGERVAHSQLIGVCPTDGDGYLLCRVTWLMQTFQGQELCAGLSILPGLPKGIGARARQSAEPFFRAFILPGVPAANSEASVVLPTGHYQSGKEFQIADENDELSFIRLKSVVERGIDFDRISYETI